MSKELGARTKMSYMSPEQTGRISIEPDSRTDIFSLGVLYWTMLLQKPAFEGETPIAVIQAVLGHRLPLVSNIRLDIPEVIGRIIQKATAKTASERYHSVSGIRHDLVEIRRLLGTGESVQLLNWEIATNDVSPSFTLPEVIIGRAAEHDAIIKVIDNALKLRQASKIQGKYGISHTSRGTMALVDDNRSSSDGRTSSLSISDAFSTDTVANKANTSKLRSLKIYTVTR